MALLMVRHMNKSGDGKALYRGGGSIAFTGLARILMLMTEHPDDAGGGDKRIALAVSKINLVKTPPTLGLTIRPSDNPDMPPRVLWDDEPLHFTADELLSATNTKQSGERRAIVRAIAEAGRPLALIEIAHAVEVDEKDTVAYGALRQRLMRMERAGQIVRVDRAVYGLPSSSNHNNTNNNNKHNNRNKHNKPFVTIVTDVMPVTEDADVTNHHDQRAELLTLAESLDWPRIPIAPAQNIGGTPDTWATFAGGASNGHIDSALRSLRFRAHGQEGA